MNLPDSGGYQAKPARTRAVSPPSGGSNVRNRSTVLYRANREAAKGIMHALDWFDAPDELDEQDARDALQRGLDALAAADEPQQRATRGGG